MATPQPTYAMPPPPPPDYNGGPPPEGYPTSGGGPPYNGGAPPPNYNGGLTPYNGGAPPPNHYDQGAQPYPYNGGAPPQGYNGGAPPQGYNAGAAPQGYNGGAPPQGYNGGAAPPGYGQAPPPQQNYAGTSGLPAPAPAMCSTALENPVIVIGSQFLATYPVDLVITENVKTLKEGEFQVKDVNGNMIFKIKGAVFSLQDKRVLVDAAGNSLLNLKQKMLSAHNRWFAHRGEGSDKNDFLFTVRRSSLIQSITVGLLPIKTILNVYLAGSGEKTPDFQIKCNAKETNAIIYLRNTSTIIAQMYRKSTGIQGKLFDKDAYTVTVTPNVDFAFISALIVVLHEINADANGED